jgi:hypothetical protein
VKNPYAELAGIGIPRLECLIDFENQFGHIPGAELRSRDRERQQRSLLC